MSLLLGMRSHPPPSPRDPPRKRTQPFEAAQKIFPLGWTPAAPQDLRAVRDCQAAWSAHRDELAPAHSTAHSATLPQALPLKPLPNSSPCSYSPLFVALHPLEE